MAMRTLWVHQSTRGLDADLADAVKAANVGDWKPLGQDRAAASFRALIMSTMRYADLLSNTPPILGPNPEPNAAVDQAWRCGRVYEKVVERSLACPKGSDPVYDDGKCPDVSDMFASRNRYQLAIAPARLMNVIAYATLADAVKSGDTVFVYPCAFTSDGAGPVFPAVIPETGGLANSPKAYPQSGGTDPVGGGPIEKVPHENGLFSTTVGMEVFWWCVGAAAVFLAGYAVQQWGAHLYRQDNVTASTNLWAKLVDAQRQHYDEERKQGKKLPPPQWMVDLTNAANKQSQVTAEALKVENQPKLPKVFPDLNEAVTDVTKTASSMTTTLVVGAVALGGLLVWGGAFKR